MEIREFAPADYDRVLALWRASEGVVLREADEREPITRYLAKNPGLSWIACEGDAVIGAVLCGSDGRRGYLQHLAVASTYRRQGIGHQLAAEALLNLAGQGIAKCHLMVLPTNAAGRAFWRGEGWSERLDVLVMSHTQEGRAHA